jgi:2-methylcitrate dehydratase PrpD
MAATTFPDGFPMLSVRVGVRLHGGRELATMQRGFRGHPANPATHAEIGAKFRANLQGLRGAGEIEEILALMRSLDEMRDLGYLVGLLAAPAGQPGWGQPEMARPAGQ